MGSKVCSPPAWARRVVLFRCVPHVVEERLKIFSKNGQLSIFTSVDHIANSLLRHTDQLGHSLLPARVGVTLLQMSAMADKCLIPTPVGVTLDLDAKLCYDGHRNAPAAL